MQRNQVGSAVAFAQPASHRPQDFLLAFVLDGPVPAQYPDQARIPIAFAEPFSVLVSIFGRKNLRASAPRLVPLITPGRKKSDVKPQSVGFSDDPIDVFEIILVRLGWIIVD